MYVNINWLPISLFPANNFLGAIRTSFHDVSLPKRYFVPLPYHVACVGGVEKGKGGSEKGGVGRQENPFASFLSSAMQAKGTSSSFFPFATFLPPPFFAPRHAGCYGWYAASETAQKNLHWVTVKLFLRVQNIFTTAQLQKDH